MHSEDISDLFTERTDLNIILQIVSCSRKTSRIIYLKNPLDLVCVR